MNVQSQVYLEGYTTKKTGWWWERYTTSNTLNVNYLADFTVNGVSRQLNTPEPDYTLPTIEATGIDETFIHGVNQVTAAQMQANLARIVIHQRSGFYTSRGLAGVSLFYNQCNP
jgi:pyruvate carboxylase